MDDKDGIAIVGVGCRFPGAGNLAEFWNVLRNGENHVIEVPRDRWNVDAFYDSDPDAPGKTYVRKVGIVKDHDTFDNRLFDINDIEASKMDPQQRFILESTFMALEDGGFPRKKIKGSNTGVYIGFMNTDYTEVLATDINQVDNYTLTGGAASIAAARVSYVFNLLGPALAVDTACSSALIAIHLASQALKCGDCDMAICGGVNCVMLPSMMIPLSKARMVSPTGASRAFSAEADGYARGEGAGIVILKRLPDAKANGDRIWAVIKTASNQDGRMASPITAPSGQQQHALLKETYTRCGINPADIQYIEAHGTGTPVGDPIEANSLGNFFGQDGSGRFIGSVKTNIGHLESAAGIAGLIKVLLMMKHATIVPSLHFTSPNPKIEFDKFNLRVPTERHPWETLSNGTRMACVNSFGFGGSNAHAVVIQDNATGNNCVKKSPGHTIVTISGLSKQALEQNISHALAVLSNKQIDSEVISYTSTCRRDHYPHRVAVSVTEGEDLLQKLKSATLGNFDRGPFRAVFVFGGMGTSWDGMCKGLLTDNHFLKAIRNIDQILQEFADICLEKEFRSKQNSSSPIIGPLMVFACQVGLFSVWKAWGITPDAIVGESVGEVAAAFASGRINLEDAVKIIFYRTKLLSTVTGGQMLVILNYPVSEVEEMCSQFDGRLNIAVYYSPTACSVSGDEDCIQAVRRVLEENPRTSLSMIPLNVTIAFHSQRMDALTEQLTEKIQHLTRYQQETQIYSTVSGKIAEENDFVTPGYWAQNLRQPVLFYQALKEARCQDRRTVYIEIGPKPVLPAHLYNIFDDKGIELLPSMERDSDLPCILNSLCQLYSMGFDPIWEQIVPICGQFSDEPKYIFQRQKTLYEPNESKIDRDGINRNPLAHPFVKRISGSTPTFNIAVNERQTPFVFEHTVGGMTLIPGTFYAEVALAVGSMVMKMPPYALTVSAYYLQPFSVQRDQEDFLTCQVQSLTTSGFNFVVFKQGVIYAHGNVKKRKHNNPTVKRALNKIKPRCNIIKGKDEIYGQLATFGLRYGKGLSILDESVANSTESLASIVTSDLIDSQLYRTHFHPSVLDAMSQAIGAIAEEGESPSNTGKPVLPAGLGSVSIFQPLEKKMFSYGKVMEATRNRASYNMLLLSTAGVVIAEVKDFVIKVVGENSDEVERVRYNLTWKPIIDFERIEQTYDKSLLAIIEDKTLTNAIIRCSDKAHLMLFKTVGKTLNIREKKHTLLQQVSNACGIILNQEPEHTTEIASADDICAYLCEACNNLRELLLLLSDNDCTIPVTILTRSTQTLSCKSESYNTINIFGSQFWGMVRCLLKEDLYPFVQLIDIADDSTATISTLMGHILDKLTPGKEVAIAAGQAYSSVIEHVKSSVPANLAVEQSWKDGGDIRVIKAPRGSSLNHDLYLQPVEKVSDTNGMSNVLLQEILLHENTFFPTTMSNEMEIWDNIKKQHVQLICLEAHGFTAETNEPVVVCLPMKACSRVSVPTACLIPRSVIPSYRIGLLTLLCFVWNIYQKIRHRKHVIIVTDETTAGLGNIIRDILRLCGIDKPECASTERVPNIKISQPTGVLLLGDLQSGVRKQLFGNNQLLELLACKGWHGDATLQECYLYGRTFNVIRLLPEEMFSVSKLERTLPNVSQLLSANEKDFAQLFESLADSQFRNISCGSLILQNNDNLKMLTTSECIFRPNASYLVVGGLGGLGWLTVCLIAEKGGGLVATVSRKPPSEVMLVKIDELKKRTEVEIVCLQADVSDQVSLSVAITHLTDTFSRFPLRGVFHGAGILDDAFLMRMSKETFDRVCMPKILGTYNLHLLTESLNLDYFVMYSSIASIAGNAGQSNYGAGNSFMDTFAHYRRSKGLAGQSINWGPLEVGMTLNNDQITQQLEMSGFIPLNKQQIKNCLVNCLLTNTAQVCFMDFNWMERNRYLYLSPDIRPIMEKGGRELEEDDSNLMLIDIQVLKQKTTDERRAVLYEYIRQVISKVLTVDIDDVTPNTEVNTLGLDSMLAMTIVNQIRKDLSVRVTIATILDNSTVEMLVEFTDSVIMDENVGILDVTEVDKVPHEQDTELSALQEMAYQSHIEWHGEHDHLFGVELQFITPAPFHWVKDVIKTVLERNKSLRTVYKQQGSSLKAVVVDDVSRIEITEIENSDLSELTERLIEISKIPFNLSTEFPLRIICVREEGNYNFGFLFHGISFDLKSLSIFFSELKNIFAAKLNGDRLPRTKSVDVARVMMESLESNISDLKHFWNSRINSQTDIPTITFAGVRAKAEMVSGYPEQLSENIPDDLRNGIDRLLSKFKVTQFQFLASVYHLLLHLVSGQNTVALKTSVDTRMFIPALNNVITRCTNGVPLIANFQPQDSIETFVVSNSKVIVECVNMALYPFNRIMKDATEKTLLNIVRHSVVSEDMSGFESLESSQTKIKTLGNLKINHETRLLIWSDKEKRVRMQLDYLPYVLSREQAKSVIDSYFSLLKYIISDFHCLIKDIPANILQKMDETQTLAKLTKAELNFERSEIWKGPGSISTHRIPNANQGNSLGQDEQIYDIASRSEARPNSRQSGDKEGDRALHNSHHTSYPLGIQVKAVLSGPITKLKQRPYDSVKSVDSAVTLDKGSSVMKITRQGWGHQVHLVLDKSASCVKWGQSQWHLTKSLPLRKIAKISLNYINGGYILILKTRPRRYYFKIEEEHLAKEWMLGLRKMLDCLPVEQQPFADTNTSNLTAVPHV